MHGYLKGVFANGEIHDGLYERNFYREEKEEIDTYDPDLPDNNLVVLVEEDLGQATDLCLADT